ncbi:PREDICTED: uncharacterized protein LOC109470485 [Branchiostoma belcheri]|uniref:Uncharacterized protein LOC109470485 n=1 Tax=Branchiostoma belcheri TaxID=7741 RepID=A0A6P4Y7J4_BRABE|nr:PREDICTED: uncharacterized protein LOC109470485 [Branchiostoma belcheri]
MQHWPPTMYGDMAEYLVANGEVQLQKRLMGDYKDGKAFSYFDSGFINEVLYHPINENSNVCFVKSTSGRSQRKNDEAHRVWVALQKSTGKIRTAYCSCFAGLGSTCNHVAGVLFKMDHAWATGVTNKSCTSKPAEWTKPRKNANTDARKIKDMEWRSPNWSKGKDRPPINTTARKLFKPTGERSKPSLEELMSDLYVSSKGACAFKYGMPTATAAFPTEHDMKVEDVVELETCVSVPLPLPDLVTLPSLPTFNTEQVDALAKATKSQSSNPTWKQQRVGRITASMARPVMVMADKFKAGSTVSRSVLDALLGRTSAPSDIPAIKYGNRMEPIVPLKHQEVSMKTQYLQV